MRLRVGLQRGAPWLLQRAGLMDEAAQDAKSAKLSRKGGAPIFSPSRLLAAVCRIAPQFKVSFVS